MEKDKLTVGNEVRIHYLDHCEFRRESADSIGRLATALNCSRGVVHLVNRDYVVLNQSDSTTGEIDGICILRNCIVDITVLVEAK